MILHVIVWYSDTISTSCAFQLITPTAFNSAIPPILYQYCKVKADNLDMQS
jgi:hypothetical protein